jgi:hypothetical protein
VDIFLFLNRITHHLIIFDRISVCASHAIGLQKILFIKGLFKAVSLNRKTSLIFHDIEYIFELDGPVNGPMVDHAGARDTHDIKLFSLYLILHNVGQDISRIAAGGHNADFIRPFGEVIAEVQGAMAVPMKKIRFFGIRDKDGFIHHRNRAFFKTDKDIHCSGFQEFLGDFSNFCGILLHYATSARFLMRYFAGPTALTSSAMAFAVSTNLVASAEDIQEK